MACELEEGENLTVGLRDLRTEPLENQGPHQLRFTNDQQLYTATSGLRDRVEVRDGVGRLLPGWDSS